MCAPASMWMCCVFPATSASGFALTEGVTRFTETNGLGQTGGPESSRPRGLADTTCVWLARQGSLALEDSPAPEITGRRGCSGYQSKDLPQAQILKEVTPV